MQLQEEVRIAQEALVREIQITLSPLECTHSLAPIEISCEKAVCKRCENEWNTGKLVLI